MDPEKVGRYEIVKLLGQGGMASVYLANDPNTKRQVAVKVLPRELTLNAQFRARFQQEAEFIAKLEHPSIVPIYDFGEHEGQPYIVMQYMAGGSLADRLDKGPLLLGDIHPIMERLAAGMDAAHRKGIIHRDLKPGNILFDLNGLAYIADFGIAKLGEAGAGLTGSGIIGTPAYMSPEQARGKETLDGRSDVYSLGVILFEMLTGKLPFEADTPMGMAVAHINDPVPDVLSLNRSLPPACSTIIRRALAKERTARFASARELASALAGLRPGAVRAAPPTRTLPGLLGSVLPVKAGARRWWLLGVGGAVAVVGGAMFILLFIFVIMPAFPQLNFLAAASATPPVVSASPPLPAGEVARATTENNIPAPSNTTGPAARAAPSQTPESESIATVVPTARPAASIDSMVLIPAGSFQMGSEDAQSDSDESPVHTVFLDAFYMDIYEVTNEQFSAFLTEQGNQTKSGASWYSLIQAHPHLQLNGAVWSVDGGFADHPVGGVTWFGAQAYCELRGARLPTEAEWEKAARGGLEGMAYPWGNNTSTCTFGASNGAQRFGCDGETAPVGSFTLNGYGLYDMAGNMYEWVADWYDPGYYESQSEWNNPSGPASGLFKSFRGGAWYALEANLRVAFRGDKINSPTYTDSGFGFRCALSP